MKETDYFPYEDIIDLPHPISKIHRPMALADRAAHFRHEAGYYLRIGRWLPHE